MESTTANQAENMFTLEDDEAYAGTEADIWQAIRIFNQLKVVDLKELAPEDRSCSICSQPYDDLEYKATKHVPVRLACSHVFGKECLAKWITPFGVWEDNEDGRWEEEQNWFHNPLVVASSSPANCPLCRRTLFQTPRRAESAKGLEARLMFFDRAYEKVGCLRSEKEEQSRADLVRYIEFYRIANGDTIEETEAATEQRWSQLERYHKIARTELCYFVLRRKHEKVLTPIQARLKRNLFHISIDGLDVMVDNPKWKIFTELHEDWEDRVVDLIYNREDDEDDEDDDSEDDDNEDEDMEDDDTAMPNGDESNTD